jgi:hypothetical protein
MHSLFIGDCDSIFLVPEGKRNQVLEDFNRASGIPRGKRNHVLETFDRASHIPEGKRNKVL